jgi:Ran GTPase-activating protein (RanGAP) involved in mRNA processing and transport
MNLDNKNLNDEGMKIVVTQVVRKKQCKKLSLKQNKITSVGASMIAEALNNNTSLEELHLSLNRISDEGICFITNTLTLNKCCLK